MRIITLLALIFSFHSAWAISFQAEKDHCAAGEFKPVNPLSGGVGGLLDATAWAETGYCVKIPIETLMTQTENINVMTFTGITRLPSAQKLPLKGGGEYYAMQIMYEAYHQHVWCQSAQWPLEWSGAITSGTVTVPNRALITVRRVPSGDSNGAYIKSNDILIELLRGPTGETSIHMRFEIEAPSQAPSNALSAITEYITRLTTAASGGKLTGPVVDPQCPY